MADMKQLVKSARQCYAINLKHSEDSPLTRLLSVLKKLQCVTDAIEAQEAEIKRLKTALANISGRGGYMPTTDYKKETELMRKIAQAALKGE